MSLLAWYPFNGNINNNGLAPCTITGTPSYSNDGILGQCLSSSEGILLTIPEFSGSRVWSVCFWGYAISSLVTSDWTRVIKISDGADYLRCEVCPKGKYSGTCCFSFHNNSGNRIMSAGLYSPNDNFYDNWTHVCITSDGSTIRTYYNGTFASSTNYNGSGAVTGSITIENNSRIKKNDLRVYDHCLSAKEVKEISKALILHYPLGNTSDCNENLVFNTNNGNTNAFGYSEAVGGSTKTVEYDNGIPCIKITRNDTPHESWQFLWHNSLVRSKIKTDTTYTISFDIIADHSGNISTIGFADGTFLNKMCKYSENVQTYYSSDKWYHIIMRTHTKESFEDITIGSQVVYMGCGAMATINRWIMMKNFKVEEGSIDTPWSPNPSDAAYNQMGYGDGIEYDVSGNGYNGTKTNTSSTSDTIKYNSSTIFNGTDACIRAQNMIIDMNNISFSVWAKWKSFKNWSRIFEFANKVQGGSYDVELANYATSSKLYFCGRRVGGLSMPDTQICTLELNKWYHIVVTIKNTECNAYINGELAKSYTLNGNFGSECDFKNNYLGKSNFTQDEYFNGSLSDFRIYGTVLSDEDIKELYEQSAFIDDKGNIGCYEFVES